MKRMNAQEPAAPELAAPVVAEDYYRQGIQINRTLADKKLVPALVGRNHAATPGNDMPAPKRAAP